MNQFKSMNLGEKNVLFIHMNPLHVIVYIIITI